MPIYVRIKRKNQTIFQDVEPTDSFLSVKEKVATVLNLEPQNIQLWHANQQTELVDLATIADQEIENDNIVYMCFRLAGSDQFEEMAAIAPETPVSPEDKMAISE